MIEYFFFSSKSRANYRILLQKIILGVVLLLVGCSVESNETDRNKTLSKDFEALQNLIIECQRTASIGSVKFRTDKNQNIYELSLKGVTSDSLPASLLMLKDLNSLTLEIPYVDNIDKLYSLKKLGLLIIEESKLSTFPDLSKCDNLDMLTLLNCKFKDTLMVSNLPQKVHSLSFRANRKIRKVVFSEVHRCGISSLDLAMNNIENIDSNIFMLPKLTHLYLYGNPINEIPLDSFKRLEVLHVDDKLKDDARFVQNAEKKGISVSFFPSDFYKN